MPEVTYATVMNLPIERIWDFVQDMNNWAPMVTGYQGHEILSDTHSIWTLKGDVGILSRTVRLDVHITEWNGPDRVTFSLKGLNEAVEGGGRFEMERIADEAAQPAAGDPPPAPRVGWLKRLMRWFFRRMFRRRHGLLERQAPSADQLAEDAAKLRFTLRMDASGATGPLVNAMLEPALLPAAEDLANRIAAQLEALNGRDPLGADKSPGAV